MDYKQFVSDYKNAKDKSAYCKKHVIKKYVPYVDKLSNARQIAMSATHSVPNDEKAYKKDTALQYFLSTMRLLSLYTDIEFSEDKVIDAYDSLVESNAMDEFLGKTPLIPVSEMASFNFLVDSCVSDIYENEHDISSVLETKMEAIRLVANTVLESFGETLGQIDVKELAQNNITPFPTEQINITENKEENA